MNRLSITEPSGERPATRQALCKNCMSSFTSSAKWWFGRWIYGNTCRKCVEEMERDKRFIRADGKEVRNWYD